MRPRRWNTGRGREGGGGGRLHALEYNIERDRGGPGGPGGGGGYQGTYTSTISMSDIGRAVVRIPMNTWERP